MEAGDHEITALPNLPRFLIHLFMCLESLSTSGLPSFQKKRRHGGIHYTGRTDRAPERPNAKAFACISLSSPCHARRAVDGYTAPVSVRGKICLPWFPPTTLYSAYLSIHWFAQQHLLHIYHIPATAL